MANIYQQQRRGGLVKSENTGKLFNFLKPTEESSHDKTKTLGTRLGHSFEQ